MREALMTTLAHISKSFRETFPVRASEWALAAILFNWSVVLFLQPDLFAKVGAFSSLAKLMPQVTFAGMCFLVGFGRLVSLAINGAWRRSPHLRAFGAFLGTGVWFMISIGIFRSGSGATGLGVYPILMLLDSYNVIRAAGEAGLSDHQNRRVADNGHPS
ncbi:membrane hypothetical protein [Mesorhizobium plurifarium]|uniref:Transmembrane protein n=1 Tax=Mesorhizobium plurifarium TaxID=69974 RepID=A0A090EET4_MESPL|nr:membrane hypothetical protein [Mesorhizobium plurifarium]